MVAAVVASKPMKWSKPFIIEQPDNKWLALMLYGNYYELKEKK